MTTISAGGGSIAAVDRGGFLVVGSAERGRRSRAGLLWPRRNAAHRHRRRRRVRLSQSRLFPRRRADARCRGLASRAGGACRQAARPRRGVGCGGHSPHRRHAHGRRGARVRRQARRRSHRRSRCCRSAARARCTRPLSRTSSTCGAFSCRRAPARSRRSAFCVRTWCTITSAPNCARSRTSRPRTPKHIYGALEDRAREELKAEGLDPADAAFLRELDLRYTGQGYELRTPLDGLYTGALNEDVAPLPRACASTSATRRCMATRPATVPLRSSAIACACASPCPSTRRAARVRPPGQGRSPMRARACAACSSIPRRPVEAIVYERDGLDIGVRIEGPCIVEQFDATTIVPPGWSAQVDDHRNLILERAGA